MMTESPHGSINHEKVSIDKLLCLSRLRVFDSGVGQETLKCGIIFHEPRDTKHESLLRSSVINGVKVKLTDERDRLLSLNGLHFQVGLLFRFVSLKRQDPLLDLRR
jgi:hypothetical protein